jgi:hypothetical protein
MASDLQILAKQIDEDFQSIKSTPFARRGIYYSVFIDEQLTSITTRRTTRVAYLIDTGHGNNTYTQLYVEDWQISVILAILDDRSFNFVKNWLIGVSRSESIEKHKVKFSRAALHDDIEAMSCESLVKIIYLNDISILPREIDTTLGFSITSRSFIDFLCLTFSMEDSNKLRIEVTKHCILADLLRRQNEATIHKLTPQLKGIKTVFDIEGLYASMGTQQAAEDYDEALFAEGVSKQYFESLASGL